MIILFISILMTALFLLQQILYKHWWDKGVGVSLNFEKDQIHAGEKVKLFEEVENRKRLPLPSLKVKFQCSRELVFENSYNSNVTDKYYRNDLFSIMPYKKITRTLDITCPQRGFYGIYAIDLVGADLFFSEEMLGHMAVNASFYVIPGLFDAKELDTAMHRINGEILTRQYELEDPFTYRGIREYEPYDEQKTINWKATAKTGDLKVNIRDHTTVNSVRLFLNLEDSGILRKIELLEAAISLSAGITERLLTRGIRTNFYSNAADSITGTPLRMEDLADSTVIDAVNKALARLDLDKPMEKPEVSFAEKLYQNRDRLFTIFISPDKHMDFQEMLLSYAAKSEELGDFLWICPVTKFDDHKIEKQLEPKTLFLTVS